MKKNYSKYIQVLLLITLFFSFSCAKQEAPTIESGARSQREIERLEACTLVNFNKGVLLHLNTLYLFKCAKWDEEFPKMYQAIKRIRSSSWDHFMAPIDKEFVENLTRRDRVFKNIKELDSKNGLDDLSRVIVALNETNFFDSVKSLFKCVENSSEEFCDVRKGNIPTKESLQKITKLIDTDPETIAKSSAFIKSLNQAIGPNTEALRTEINKFRVDPAFISLRLKLVDALAMKIKNGLSNEDRRFISNLLLIKSSKDNVPWLYSWIHDAKMNRDKFRDLVEYPILTNPIFVSEVRGLKAAYDDNFTCTIKNPAELNELITFDYKTHVYDILTVIKNKDQKYYFDYASEGAIGMKLSSEICRELETNKYGVNFPKMLGSFVSFLGEKKFYEFAKFLVNHTTVKGELDKNFAENLYMADFIASEIFSTSTVLNEKIIKRTRDFYPVIYDVIQKFPPEAYLNLGEVLQDLLKEESDEKFQGIVSFWNFFNETEKNFVFNFVDRHFEGDTQYVLLFDFYTKFLDDLYDVQPSFKEAWMGTKEKEEQSYLAMQDLFYQLDGKDTLLDFQKFFGRDQILRVLEVISNGSNIHANAKAELAHIRSNEYLARSRSERYVFQVTFPYGMDPDYDSTPVLECIKVFSNIENGYYQLVRKLPEVCAKVSDANIAFRVFGWLNSVEDAYKEFKPGTNSDETLLSAKGILSPYMLNTTVGTAKILDSLLGGLDSKVPTQNGVHYLMSSAKHHLNEKNAAALVDKNLLWLKKWFESAPEQNLIHRNALVKTFTRAENFSRANEISKNLANLSTLYGDWVMKGKWQEAQNRSLGTYDPNSACEKVINHVVTEHPCPSTTIIKKHANEVVKYLYTIWEKEEGSAISHILKGVKPGEGLDIPLDGKKTKKYRLTLKEVFKYLYDTSNKNLEINKRKVYFVNKDGKGTYETLTTLERIETVIREVRFDNNYLGVAFLNAIVHAEDYTDEAKTRKSLLSKCLKIPGIRCTRPMSDDDLRMGKNALETFDSLIEVNTEFSYGNFLKTFEQSLVGSSAKKAQEVQLMALKDEYLLQHNGRLLGDMTALTMWSNSARVIRDRVGRKPEDFNKFINSPAFNRVNNAILYGFDLPQAVPSAERLLRKINAIPSGEKQNIIGDAVDWMASLNYDQVRLVEDTVARLLLVSAYLGSPDVVFGAPNAKFDRYKENNLLQIFLALEKIIDHYPTLKNFMPKDMALIDAFKPLNNALVFLTDALESTNNPEDNIAYIALNDLFSVSDTAIFDEMGDPRFASLNSEKVKGIDLLIKFISNPKNVYQTYDLIREDYRYLNVLHEGKGAWFKVMGQNVNRVANAKRVDFTPIRDYLNFTSKSGICLNRDSECIPNYHFDELANLLKFLTEKNENGTTYFSVASKKLLVENFDQLNQMIDDLLPALKIKEVKPPLTIN